jgi:hypothetical protein
VNWQNNGYEIKANTLEVYPDLSWDNLGWKISNENRYFAEATSWTCVSTSLFSARYVPGGSLFDTGGSFIPFADEVNNKAVLGFLNTRLAQEFLSLLNPTINYGSGTVGKLPWVEPRFDARGIDELIRISKADWDNFETSWDFRGHPLLQENLKKITLEESWRSWEVQSTASIYRMQELEMDNNRVWIEAYQLQDEFSPEVREEQITLARADVRQDMAAYLSYAVGCMLGRYSLDAPGLILADAGDTLENYLAKVGKPLEQLTFAPDEDGIIPVLDGEWFEDDVVARTRGFLRATFGEATLRENLRFIEESLGKELRKYFLTDFYRDHLQTYRKRPIYWMVQSPKKGFSVLIYLHRYTRDTMNLVLNRYLREYQAKLRDRLAHLARVQANDSLSARERTAARKEADKLTRVLHECEEWERQTLLPLAQQRIELDLDDGVNVNYLKLGEALAPIPGLAAKGEE